MKYLSLMLLVAGIAIAYDIVANNKNPSKVPYLEIGACAACFGLAGALTCHPKE